MYNNLIIQLEKTNFKDFEIIDKDMIIDTAEDGCIVGLGYSLVEELSEKEKIDCINNILSKIEKLGGKVNLKNKTFTVTEDLCINYSKLYFEKFKDAIIKMDYKDFSKIENQKELDLLKCLLPFYNIEVYSDSLNYGCESFNDLFVSRFSSSNEYFKGKNIKILEDAEFKIIEIFSVF